MKQTRIVFLFLVIWILPLSTVHADFVGINIGASQWSPTLPGSFGSNDNGTSIDLSHKDTLLYYQLLDNWIDLDMGIDLKRFDGEVELAGDSSSRLEIDKTIPLLYLSARFNLPYDGFYIGANFNNLSLNDSNVEDSTIKLGYETNYGIGFEGGFQSFSLELDGADNLNTDLKYDGVFLNGYYHF